MKKILIAGVIAGFAFSPAIAGELEDYCTAYVTGNGGDPSGCSCLEEASDGDMTAEILGVESDEDIQALSEASKEAIAACFPES